MTGMPGAGDAHGGDPARAEQHVQRTADLCRAWVARRGIAQAGHLG